MSNRNYDEIIKPLLIEEKRSPSEVRRHCRLLSRELAAQIRRRVPDGTSALFAFVLRGAMLLYPPLAEEFEEASFCFIYPGSRTDISRTAFDTVVIVDTVIETGKTVISTKKLLKDTGISAKNWFVASVCANKTVREKLNENFGRVFCLEYLDNVRVTIDAGEYYTRGDDAHTEQVATC